MFQGSISRFQLEGIEGNFRVVERVSVTCQGISEASKRFLGAFPGNFGGIEGIKARGSTEFQGSQII